MPLSAFYKNICARNFIIARANIFGYNIVEFTGRTSTVLRPNC